MRGSHVYSSTIETAPKDGTPVLGFMPSYYQGTGGQSVILWMDTNGRGGRWFDNRAWETTPTHWMPPPDPPGLEGGEPTP